jgi:hypothetical protein
MYIKDFLGNPNFPSLFGIKSARHNTIKKLKIIPGKTEFIHKINFSDNSSCANTEDMEPEIKPNKPKIGTIIQDLS